MECREVRPLIEAFVSEQLLVETTQAIVTHLERCPGCRAEVDGLRRMRTALRSGVETSADLSPRPEFLSILAARLQTEALRRRPAWRQRRAWMAIAASLIVVLGSAVALREWSASTLEALLHAAVGDHRFCALTFKLAEPPIPLAEAAQRFGGVHALLAAVEPDTTTLSGGPLRVLERHSCVFESRRFVHIVLHYKDEPISVLVPTDRDQLSSDLWGVGPPTDGTTAVTVNEGFHVASFRSARHVVFVVSSLNDHDLQEVATAVVGPVSRALAGA